MVHATIFGKAAFVLSDRRTLNRLASSKRRDNLFLVTGHRTDAVARDGAHHTVAASLSDNQGRSASSCLRRAQSSALRSSGWCAYLCRPRKLTIWEGRTK